MKRGLILILLVAIFVSSCQQGGKDPTADSPFIGGTGGVTVAFAEDQPPRRVLDNNQQEFPITLLLRNQGEYTVPTGGLIASLSGISKKAFGLQQLDIVNDFVIQGAYKDIGGALPGAQEYLEFGDASYAIDIPADFRTRVRADICYTYQTKALANLCLKKNVLQKDVDDVCDVKMPNLAVPNSGGPFQVVSMRQDTVGKNKVKLNFKVKNLGVGLIYKPGTFKNTCSGQDQHKDKVMITLTSPNNNFQASCGQFGGKHTGEVRLINGEKDISCTIDTSTFQEVTFQDLLIVQMDYMYRNAVVTDLVVENAG